MENGVQAMIAAKEGICTKAVENVIEANTYLSGIGFESGGLAGALCDPQRIYSDSRNT